MNEPWHIQLFGRLHAQQAQRSITRFRTQKTGSLLAYLAYHRQRSHARDSLIELLWPDTTPESGRHNLSLALSSLRSQLELQGVPAGAVLVADRFTVELNPDAFTTDVADFEQALRLSMQARNTPEQRPLLLQAVAKYTGPLLPGYYEGWIVPEQERLAQRFLQAVTLLIALWEKGGETEQALELAQRAVSLEPLREEAQRELLRLLLATGQPEAALRQFQEYERALAQELAAVPGPTIQQMAQQIHARLCESRPPIELPAATRIAPPVPSSPPPTALPTGTVTFLLTDREGSTALWEKTGEAFRSALTTHHALLRAEFRRNGGQELKEAGDSFLVAFASAGDALACALSSQRALAVQPWPEEVGRLNVRMALHTGDVELEAGEYHGLVLHHAARMLSAAHGGQILCSEATAGVLKRELDPDIHLKDLGVWRLKDVEVPERLFEVDYPDRAVPDFPPLNATPAHRSRLPLQFTRFFGRESEIAQIIAKLTDPATRLLTLTGPGGTGKTRLAIEALERFSDSFSGEIWFVSLADLSDPRLIPVTILLAMGLPLEGSQPPIQQLKSLLDQQVTLLLLDNFEPLVEGGAEIVQELLASCSRLQCLVTSRQLLGLPGEQELAVSPLPTPNGTDTPERLSLFESVRLFVDRAQAAKPDFQVTLSNAPDVAELCDRLEGIPLAIELAAARALVLTPMQMLQQLSNRFEFLVSRKRGVAERQRTLRATVEWSYRLLAPELQRFFARLSVFRGGWTVEAAEAVCEEPLALDALSQLRESSLVLTEEGAGQIRFRMLETLREYAEERLSAQEKEEVERHHAAYFLNMAEEAGPHLKGAEQATWLARLEAERDNLRAALAWCARTKEHEMRLRLAGALWRFWDLRGYFVEGRRELAEALEAAEGQAALRVSAARALALSGAGSVACEQGDFAAARALHEESLAIKRELGDKLGISNSLHNLAMVVKGQGDFTAARTLYAEGLAIKREIGDKWGMANSLGNLGNMDIAEGDFAAGRALYEESLEIRRELGDKQGIASSLMNLGNVAKLQGDYAAARALYEESLEILRELGHKQGIAYTLSNLGTLAYRQGDYAAARALYTEGLEIHREIIDKWAIANALQNIAGLAAGQEQRERAARLWAAAEGLREAINSPLPAMAKEEFDRVVAEARASLAGEAFAAAWEAGRAMSWEAAVAYALEEMAS